MKLNILIFKNKRLDCFTQPNFDDHEPEVAAIQLSRSLIANKDKEDVIKPYRFLDMYVLGIFDDQSGQFELLKEPRLLLDCSKVLGISEAVIDGKVD